jgi:hypothetical protein
MDNNNILIKKLGATNTSTKTTPKTPKTPSYADATKTTPTAPPHDRNAPFNHAAWIASLDPMGHCWSHGHRVQVGHDSQNCKGKLGGHCDGATRADTMGGSAKGKP